MIGKVGSIDVEGGDSRGVSNVKVSKSSGEVRSLLEGDKEEAPIDKKM